MANIGRVSDNKVELPFKWCEKEIPLYEPTISKCYCGLILYRFLLEPLDHGCAGGRKALAMQFNSANGIAQLFDYGFFMLR